MHKALARDFEMTPVRVRFQTETPRAFLSLGTGNGAGESNEAIADCELLFYRLYGLGMHLLILDL